MNPITREDPLWEDSRVPHSCQARSRQTCLWKVMISLTKTFYCKDTENELKSDHNKTWKPTSRQWWSDWIPENKRQSPETFLVLSSLVWRKVEEQHGRRRRRKEKISILNWPVRNNSWSPSSSRSFRTQSYWSFITGQCHYSGRFLSTFIMSDVQSTYIPSSIQDWYRLEDEIDHDRTGKPLFALKKERPTHVFLVTTRTSMWKTTNHDRTGKPVVCRDTGHEHSIVNEVDIDFRIPGLPHSVVKQAGYLVRELVKNIENHLTDNLFNEIYNKTVPCNPFSEKSKKMIQDVGNVQLFELFETDPRTQRKECLLHWSLGIINCTCGHLLKESEANRGAIQCTLDLLSIPNYVIKKGRPHGHRCGNTTAQRDQDVAHNLWKRCIKRHFQGIHHRFVTDPEFRAISTLEHDRDEEVCIKMDELAQKDFRHHMTFDTEGICRFLSIIPDSTRRCPHCTTHTKNLENDNSGQCHSGSTNTGTNRRVLPPVGGNGTIPGGAHNNSFESPHMSLTCKATL